MIVIVVGIALVVLYFWLGGNGGSRPTPPSGRTSQTPSQGRPSGSYRPRSSAQVPGSIQFRDLASAGGGAPSEAELKGLRDAFTGAPLDPALGLRQCQNCKVYYHTGSYDVVRQENAGRCVACGSTAIPAVGKEPRTGRNFEPGIVTLANFREHFGRVVTFEGEVRVVRVSRRGTDFAVCFENKSWVTAFKLVFFRHSVSKVGGASFVRSLEGRRVRVRGLLINHAEFGPEIIISQRSMILEIS